MTANRLVTAALLLIGTAACAGNPRPAGGAGGDSAALAVERFLHLAQAQSYVEMGWVFGTESGPVIQQWPRPEVEQRMYAIARVLSHDSFVVGQSQAVPGRIGKAERFTVSLQARGKVYQVPFTAVRGPRSRWYVEQVDLQAVTGSF